MTESNSSLHSPHHTILTDQTPDPRKTTARPLQSSDTLPSSNKPINHRSSNRGNGSGRKPFSQMPGLNPGAKVYMPSPSNATNSRHSNQEFGRQRQGRTPRHDDGVIVNMDPPQTTAQNERRRDGRRRARDPKAMSSESSSSSAAPRQPSNHSQGDNRRSNTRRGGLNGRTFPTPAPENEVSQETHTHARNTRVTSRRNAPAKFVHKVEEDRDLLAALTDGLTHSTYDCMVCWDVIRPAHKIWNCKVCWAAFHLDCLSTWATKSSDGSNASSSGWRCPGCQNTQVTLPKEYNCFCGKVSNPDYNRYLTPHSCGELCGRSRDCPHSCNLPCHPGPCPPCNGQGPVQYCYCGEESFQLRCADTDFTFQTGKSCGKICDELLGCGKHSCSSPCHPGLCPPCGEEQEQNCYCGKHQRVAQCGDGEPKTTIVDGKEQTGYFECTQVCERPLACGHHNCSQACHPLDSEPGQCPAAPETVKTCPCGSKSVEVLLGKSRSSCLDLIPVCGSICQKVLQCGHLCANKCHLGKCAPCTRKVAVDCRCGSTHIQRICSDSALYGNTVPICDKLCRGLRSCGKHQCTNRCCPAKNQPLKGGKVDLAAHEAHACTLVCGKKLQCGVHTCEMLCHKGHCDPCLNASFDELSCSCGRTVLYPPIACGTSIPKCKYTCNRERECGHASLSSHPCHPDSEPCPPCIMLVTKQCMCRKSKMPNSPCYKSNPSCGKICGKRLECSLHNCTKSCHSGECAVAPAEICAQPCPKLRKSCGHRCGVVCHGQEACPEDVPCQVTVASSCKCGHLTLETACHSSAENPWDGKPRVIKCNDYCLMAERNKRVALALDIDETVKSGPRIPEYDEHVLEYAGANMEFTLKMEKQIGEWVADSSKQILYLPAMKGHRRKFVHELAAHYNVSSESVDVEPYRSVTIHRKLNTSVPGLLASQACRQRRPAVSQSATGSGVEQLRKSMIKDPVNAIYLHELVFGLTRLELSNQLTPVFGNIKYGIRWLTDDDAVLIPQPGSMQMDELETLLVHLCTGIKTVASLGKLCDRVELCWVNKDGQVMSQTKVAGGSSQPKKFFSVSQGNHWLKKAEPAKVKNAFSILDDDERIASAKKAEQDRIMKAKEAAGTLSMEAWEEGVVAPGQLTHSSPLSAEGHYVPSRSVSPQQTSPKFTSLKKPVQDDKDVADDWQDLVDKDEDDLAVPISP